MSLDAEMSREYGRRALKRVSFNTVAEQPDKSVLKKDFAVSRYQYTHFYLPWPFFKTSAMMAEHISFVAISNSYPLNTPRVDYSVFLTAFIFL